MSFMWINVKEHFYLLFSYVDYKTLFISFISKLIITTKYFDFLKCFVNARPYLRDKQEEKYF